MTILDHIIASKHKEVAEIKNLISVNQLEKKKGFQRTPISLKNSLLQKNSSGIIAEFKRKSPSKGIINNLSSVEDVTKAYSEAGAAGISILTDSQYFGGFSSDILSSRELIPVPVLRKEFIIDEYQIVEAKSIGADVILLIAACLDKQTINKFTTCALSLGLEVLLEIHTEEELEKINDKINLIGINNRNLKTFKVDLEHSIHLSTLIPESYVKISESGIEQTETINMLKSKGFKGFLIGEIFMKTTDPGTSCKEFIQKLQQNNH